MESAPSDGQLVKMFAKVFELSKSKISSEFSSVSGKVFRLNSSAKGSSSLGRDWRDNIKHSAIARQIRYSFASEEISPELARPDASVPSVSQSQLRPEVQE